MHEELWKQIVILHNTNKSYFIWCEDNGYRLKGFLQPNNELKNAWEHVVRSKAAELGILNPPNLSDYVNESLNDALSHEYRAFFDICDWLSMNLRKRIIDLLQPYDNATITAVLPAYYTEVRPKFDRFCGDIAKLRTAKDIGLGADILVQVNNYNGIISSLMDEVNNISQSIPALEEFKNKNEKTESRGYSREIGLLIAGALLLAFAEWLFSFL